MAKKRDWDMTPKQQRIAENLWKQVEKIFDFRNRSQGYRGLERYREGLRSFCKHLAIEYQSKNFRNISNKHLKSFIDVSKEAKVSPKTLKTDLSAIRKLHEKVEDTRYNLGTNEELGYTDKRVTRGIDRAWRDSELHAATSLAHDMRRMDVKWSLSIARHAGLRIEEVTALTKTQLRNALHNGYLELQITKGGIPRDVPVTSAARHVFQEILTYAESEKIFVNHGRSHHQAFKSIQNWIGNYRSEFQESYHHDTKYQKDLGIDQERPNLTAHGLRHSYARDQYEMRVEAGIDKYTARKEVAALLGHGRDDVTRIYLGKK